jgi:hypothetical protein
MAGLELTKVDMDEYVVIDRFHDVNVWVHEGDVYLAIDAGDVAQVKLNLVQAEKIAALLTQAVVLAKDKD